MLGFVNQLFKQSGLLILSLCLCLASVLFVNANAKAAIPNQVKFYGSPNSSIASAVAVPAEQAYFWTSGTVPPIVNESAPAGSRERYGDTKTQAIGTLKRIEEMLKEVNLQMSDITYLRVYLVADPLKDNQIDYPGWFEAYGEYFNNDRNPTKVARSTVGVAGLVNPDWLVEIEAVAVYPRI